MLWIFSRSAENVGGVVGHRWGGKVSMGGGLGGVEFFLNDFDFSWSPENVGVVAGYRWVGRVKERR